MSRVLLVALAVALLAVLPWATFAPAFGEDAAATGGSIEVTVRDERGQPIEGAVAWVAGVKPRTPVPAEPVILEQEGLAFRPPFVVARRGQKIEVRNSDPEVHNVHAGSHCCAWNFSVTSGKSETKVVDESCEATLLCDIHAHMRAQLLVVDADYVRTDARGVARLDGIPAGKRRLQLRAHDRVPATLPIEVAAATVTSVAATLAAPPPAPDVVPPEKLPWPALAGRAREALEAAVSAARTGDADRARDKADEAEGRWFSGSGFFDELRRFDAESENASHRRRCEELRSALRRFKREAGLAAQAPPEERSAKVADLAEKGERLAASLLEASRQLPKREGK